MTTFTTSVLSADAPMHSGTGDQHVHYYYDMKDATRRLRAQDRDPRNVAERDLNWLYQRFVPPGGFGRARGLLRGHGSVVLSGAAGSGRRTAALMLLFESGADGAGIHEIDPGHGEDEATLDRGSIGDGDRVVLDLSTSDTTRYLRVQTELAGFRAVAEKRRARLVVVISPHLKGSLAPELRHLIADVERPPADELMMRYLRRQGIALSPVELRETAVADHLAKAPLRDVAWLAHLIGVARERDPRGRFPEWWAEALAQVMDHGTRTARFIAGLEDGRQRALALTVAMLHGSPPDTIHQASVDLLNRVGHPEDERPRLDRADLTSELAKISAPVETGDGVRFRDLGRDRAVLSHFWTYFPDLRPDFRVWVENCLRTLRLDGEARRSLVARFAEQALRVGQPEDLLGLARAWTERGDGRRLLPDAAELLAHGLRHGVHGHALRRQILDCVSRPALPTAFRLAIVVVCEEVMALRHPDQALVRLHHLARAEGSSDRRPACDALTALAIRERRLCAYLLRRLVPHSEEAPRFPTADGRIFLALADEVSGSHASLMGPVVVERLSAGWAAVLRQLAQEVWAPHVERWLDAALAADQGHRALLLATLADSGADQPSAVSRMYVVSRRWAHARVSDRVEAGAVAAHFRRCLDAAQGLAPLAFATSAPHTSEMP
ncbi:ABC transporter substrate-binding protein [Streptomyces sp. PT12]|uniref:ABC transporter substrate-binding protein n=1 Tax=Streptomyces sp. PT12 TaxID=1510197 RepID=UPI000DE1F39E|nr:ABC transporter substrate-binding protein [Streptomyces sp. PT12]RBM18548.1 ABC transporter substrate-binding protein [Streptomyces sp. PT12]